MSEKEELIQTNRKIQEILKGEDIFKFNKSPPRWFGQKNGGRKNVQENIAFQCVRLPKKRKALTLIFGPSYRGPEGDGSHWIRSRCPGPSHLEMNDQRELNPLRDVALIEWNCHKIILQIKNKQFVF